MKKFPHYKQLDSMDCGPTCLRMVAKYYGKSYGLQYLRSRSYITREGVSLMGISEAAEHIGFRTKGFRLTWDELCDDVPLPCIVHWKQRHFVVVYAVKREKSYFRHSSRNNKREATVYVADPARGLLSYKKDEFLNCWLSSTTEGVREGAVLLLEPTPDFYKHEDEEKEKLKLIYLLNYLRPYRKYIVQLGMGMLTGSIISLIFPFLTQSIVDYGINNSDLAFIVMVLIAQMVLTFGQTANGLIRSWIMLHITSRISISLITDFLIKLMKLPIAFFDIKMVGDIMQRINDHSRIQSFLTKSLIDILFATLTLTIYIVVMATYHMGILGIFIIGSILYIAWVLIFLKRRREIDYKRFQQSSANSNNVVQLVNGMQEIKLNGCEKQKRWEWESIQAKLYRVSIKGLSLNQNQQIGATFINQAKDLIISFLSAKAVITGDMTLGMMMAVQYILGQLNSPIQQFIGFTQQAQDAKISLERLSEIHNRDDEENLEDRKIREIPSNADIELKNVMFQYEGPHSEKVLKKINLKIPSNKITAIVGTSGSGKTTLMKLLLGFYEPIKGSILLNQKDLQKYSESSWRKRCGVVMQEGFIFSDSIANNIGVMDEIPVMEKLEQAVFTANISSFIDKLPLRYDTKIGSQGHGLSTGQKQRILIARAVYKNPDYIFFDEATNALDVQNEKIIMENLNQFFQGRTVVVIAHRLSTVKKADQIVVLEKGEIIEQGTHKELVNGKGTYFDLVKDQLELGE
ncbi:peptidase domain-containing ABC transporter [Draconibacterium sp. IB214405]|uniref:peptidase domain-containing ABC transporter n=1 Tax=Draconibacterium sp. IB214405 TaxID=3097352 RepID=UPI002A164698|nr:peptidase domain-containing ABC transporter [Draconibacterium sp. IB214405]MDX8341767.1 peptidase domain-containing ABC transporter [Draconibacterium sp. IB214405]